MSAAPSNPAPVDAAGRPRRRPRRVGLPVLLAGIALLLAAMLYGRHLDAWRIDDDEEGYLYAAWRVGDGDVPYRDFLTPQLPGFLYPGAAVIRLAGPSGIRAPRAWSALLVLVAGGALFVAGRELLGAWGGLLAMTLFLFSNDVYLIARAFRPEALMLATTCVALALFVRAEMRARPLLLAAASLVFGAGLLAKLFAALPWIAACTTVVCAGLTTRGERGRRMRDLALLAVPGLLLVAAVMGGFIVKAPQTEAAILGHQLRQGAELSGGQVALKALGFYRSAFEHNTMAVVFVPAGILGLLLLAGPIGWLAFWQVASVSAFLLLSRELFDRHLVYLAPTLALCYAAAAVWLAVATGAVRARGDRPAALVAPVQPDPRARLWARVALLLLVAGRLVTQGADLAVAAPRELGTAGVAAVVRALTAPDTPIVADTGGPAYYAGRRTTYAAAGLSEGAAGSGQITGAELLDQMASDAVGLVLVDTTAGGHLSRLRDYEAFLAAVHDRYPALGYVLRHDVRLDVYGAAERPPVELGGLRVVAARPRTRGTEVAVDIALGAQGAAGTPDLEVSLVDASGAAVATDRPTLTNALGAGPAQWGDGELVGLTARLVLPPGAPPGAYDVRVSVPGRPAASVATVVMP